MWIPLELISPKFALLKRDLIKCKTNEERKDLLKKLKKNWKYSWMADEIKDFFKNNQHWKLLG